MRQPKNLKLLTLEDIPETLEKAITLMDYEIERMTRQVTVEGEDLSASDQKALVSYTTCLYQTSKDERARIREINSGIQTLDEVSLRKLASKKKTSAPTGDEFLDALNDIGN